MQQITHIKWSEELVITLPGPTVEIVPGVPWGDACALFTPAYWYTQYHMHRCEDGRQRHRLGQTFAEELTACLLGGYGIPAEVGNAAFERLRNERLIDGLCDDVEILESRLREPLQVGNRRVRYRFWRQKARYLAVAYRRLRSAGLQFHDAISLRNSLLLLPGVGPKTASWIVRNWMNSDEVAILDIHIVRAGVLMNLYRPTDRPEKQYLQMEKKFIALAKNMKIPTSDLDALIWSMMRTTPHLVTRLLGLRSAVLIDAVPIVPAPMPMV